MNSFRPHIRLGCLLWCLLVAALAHGQLPGVPGVGVGVPGGGGGGGTGPPDIPDNILYGYPNPYANRAVSYRSVYLITAEEIEQLQDGNGNTYTKDKALLGLSFFVDDAKGQRLRNFRISLAEVDYDEFPDEPLEETFTEVHSQPVYIERNGENYHAFHSPYCYTGEKNLLVQVCVQNNPDESSFNAGILYVDSTWVRSYHDWSDDSEPLCNTNSANAQYYEGRPVVNFRARNYAAVDMSVLSATNPTGLEYVESKHLPEIRIFNNSCESQDTYEIGYQLEGQPAVREFPAYTMASGERKTFVFSDSVLLDEPGFHIMRYWVSNSNDNQLQNDTLTRLIWVRKDEFEGLDYTGTDFWIGYMHNQANPNTLIQEVYVTGLDETEVTVSIPLLGWSRTVSLQPFEVKKVVIDNVVGGFSIANDEVGVARPTGINITSESEISVYALSTAPNSSDAYLAIPNFSLGREYFAIAPIGTFAPADIPGVVDDEQPAEILIISPSDNTEVEVILSQPANGRNAGDTLRAFLNRGETYLVKANVERLLGIPNDSYDLTGTRIKSNNKVAVISGSQCATVPGFGEPGACQFCDHIMEELQPASTWGQTYYLTDYAYKQGNDFARIVNGEQYPTTVNVAGDVYVLDTIGDYVNVPFNGNVQIVSTNPVQVIQMCTGGQCDGSTTDPFYINAIPDVQWGSNYTFTTISNDRFNRHYINVVKRSPEGRVAIDGNLIDPNLFTPITNTHYAAKLAITEGNHMVTTDTTVSVSVYGFGVDDGYGYPASGAKLRPINIPPPDVEGVVNHVSCYQYGDGQITVEGVNGTPPYIYIWEDGPLGATRSNLEPGSYTVTVIDDYGLTAKKTFVVTQPDPFFATFQEDSVRCFGESTGQLTASIEGGNPPYSNFYWEKGESKDVFSTSFTITNLLADEYRTYVTDSEGCRALDTVEVKEPNPLVFNADITRITCYQADDGAIGWNISGGTAPYNTTFTRSDGSASATENLIPGTYRIATEDAKGCEKDTLIELTEATFFSQNFSITPSGCKDIATGSIAQLGTGGEFPYSYAFNGGAFGEDNTLDSLQAGSYQATIRDNRGCEITQQVEVNTVPVPSFSVDTDPETCQQENGVARMQIDAPGTTPYNGIWLTENLDTLATGSVANNLTKASYLLVASDAHCTDTLPFDIEALQRAKYDAEITPETCNAGNGSITITVTESTGNATIRLNNRRPNSANTFTNLEAGNYELRIADEACDFTEWVEVPYIQPPTIDSTHIAADTCLRGIGAATVFISSDNGPLTFTWPNNPNADSNSIANVTGGNYPLIVSDGLCETTFDIAVPELRMPEVNFFDNPTRCESENGRLEAVLGFFNGEVSFEWTHNQDRENLIQNQLDSGWYSITVTDDFCTVVDSGFVDRFNDFEPNATIVGDTCETQSGSVVLNPGSERAYDVVWNEFPDSTSLHLYNLEGGAYTGEISSGLCTYYLDFTVPTIRNPRLNANITPERCEDRNGAIVANPIGTNPISLQWLDTNLTSYTRDSLVYGHYPYQLSDAYCTVVDSVFVPPSLFPPVIVSLEERDATCGEDNGVISLEVYGPQPEYDLVWSEPSFGDSLYHDSVPPGEYTLNVYGRRCARAYTVIIEAIPELNVEATVVKNADCNEASGRVDFTVQDAQGDVRCLFNGIPYSDFQFIDNLDSGWYYYQFEDDLCSVVDSVYVPLGSDLTYSVQSEQETCSQENGSVAVAVTSAAGAVTGTWNDGYSGLQRNNLVGANYVVEISDSLCSYTEQIALVNSPLPPTITLNTKEDATCGLDNGALDINVSGPEAPYTYTWSDPGMNGSLVHTGLEAGGYELTVSGDTCTVSQIFGIGQVAPLQVIPDVVKNADCGVASGIVGWDIMDAIGAVEIVWNGQVLPNTQPLTDLPAGTYNYTASDNLCTVTGTVTVPLGLDLSYQALVQDENCSEQDGSITIQPVQVAGSLQQQWNDGNTNLIRTNLSSGSYTIILEDSLCVKEETFDVGNNEAPGGTLSVLQTEACGQQDGAVYFTPNSHVNRFTWNTGVQNVDTLRNLGAGVISLIATNAYCDRDVQIELPQTLGPQANPSIQPEYCDLANGLVALNTTVAPGHQPLSVTNATLNQQWSTDTLRNLVQNTYSIHLLDGRGCDTTFAVTVPALYERLRNEQILWTPEKPVRGNEVLLDYVLPKPWEFTTWSVGGQRFTADYPVFNALEDSIRITLYAQHPGGCVDSSWVWLEVIPSDVFYAPNSFTPDNDGVNDVYYPVADDVLSWSGRIFNRWGEQIHYLDQNSEPWDGRYKGKLVKNGTYPVIFTYTDMQGINHRKEAMITVIR